MRPLVKYVHASWWQKGMKPSLSDLVDVEPGRPDGRAWSAYGQVLLAAAHAASDADERQRYLQKGEQATRKALRLSPAQAATWARLALIAVNRGDRGLAVRSLERSMTLAPNGVNLAWPRVKLGLYLWDDLNLEMRAAVESDMKRLLKQKPTLALPYPDSALRQYATSVGRSELVAEFRNRWERDAD